MKERLFKALEDAEKELNRSPLDEEVIKPVGGVIELNDGRLAEIQIRITTNREDFIDKTNIVDKDKYDKHIV